MKKYFVFLIVSITIFQGCNKPTLDAQGLKFIAKNYPLIPLENPQFYKKDSLFFPGESWTAYIYADTLENIKEASLLLKYYPEKDSFALRTYGQSWEDENYKYFLKMEYDTTSYYKKNIETRERTFYIGEYDHKRIRNHFSKDPKARDEIIYYDLYRDSLRLVRGNNLPPLPTPTPEERLLWEEKFGNVDH